MAKRAGLQPHLRVHRQWQRALEMAAMLILLGLAVLRPLILETYDSSLSSFDEAIRELDDPTPIRTLGFDLLILAAGCLWLLGRAIGDVRRFRWTGIEFGVALIFLASVISSIDAGQKRLAFNASFDWLCAPLAAVVLVQLLREHWQRRLLLGAVLATACVQALQCFEDYSRFEETWAYYQQIKEKFWAEQGIELGSSRVDLYEQRMKAREAAGFFAHSNVAASYLALCGLTGLGVVIQRWRARTTELSLVLALLATCACAAMAGAIYLTGSRGAMVASLAGVGLWAALTVFDRFVQRHRMRALMAGWMVLGGILVGVVIYGLARESLPGASLNFRWQYWMASARMISDHPWAGVGRENFGRHYTQYKPIEAPEEISNPHNILVHAAAEWGIFGLVGLAAMLFGGSIMATRVTVRRARKPAPEPEACTPSQTPFASPAGPPAQSGTFLLSALWLALIATLVRLPFTGIRDEYLMYYMTVTAFVVWAVGFAAFGIRITDPLVRCDAQGRSSAAVKGASVGLFAFLLHDFINFAAFNPAACYTAFTLFAFIASARYETEDPPLRRASSFFRWAPFITSASASLLLLVFFVPAIRANRALAKARKLPPQFAVEYLERACEADRLDPTPFAEKARLLASTAAASPNAHSLYLQAAQAAEEAIRRDPFAVSLRRMQRSILLQAAHAAAQHGSSAATKDEWEAAIEAGQKAVELYPASPQDLIDLADTQLAAGEGLDSDKLLQEAIESYNRGLGLDAQRPDWEWLRRLRSHEVLEVERKIAHAQTLLTK